MRWEALTALSTFVTALVIGVTAVIALIQITHLRRATQLQSFLDLMSEATSPQMSVWTAYVETVLPQRLKDEQYRNELIEGRLDFEKHKELFLGAFWEKIGALVHYGLIDSDVFIDYIGAPACIIGRY